MRFIDALDGHGIEVSDPTGYLFGRFQLLNISTRDQSIREAGDPPRLPWLPRQRQTLMIGEARGRPRTRASDRPVGRPQQARQDGVWQLVGVLHRTHAPARPHLAAPHRRHHLPAD